MSEFVFYANSFKAIVKLVELHHIAQRAHRRVELPLRLPPAPRLSRRTVRHLKYARHAH